VDFPEVSRTNLFRRVLDENLMFGLAVDATDGTFADAARWSAFITSGTARR
jgi:hypothetical protein